jgi:hypothetical protein
MSERIFLRAISARTIWKPNPESAHIEDAFAKTRLTKPIKLVNYKKEEAA